MLQPGANTSHSVVSGSFIPIQQCQSRQQRLESMPDQAVAMGIVAARVRLFGHVQGIGVRPAIYNLAQQMQLSGRVVNDATGVDIFIQGTDKELDEFRCRLVDSLLEELMWSDLIGSSRNSKS